VNSGRPRPDLGQILDFLSKIVSPDWGRARQPPAGLLAPLVLLFLADFVGAARVRPASRAPTSRYVEGPRPADRDRAGDLLFAPGTRSTRPPASSTRRRDPLDRGAPLAVACPMCRVERSAEISTCGNCGLVLRIAAPVPLARPAGPPPGGAAAA
jgi:hypothetical protein